MGGGGVITSATDTSLGNKRTSLCRASRADKLERQRGVSEEGLNLIRERRWKEGGLLEGWVVPTEPDMVTGVDAECRDAISTVKLCKQHCRMIAHRRCLMSSYWVPEDQTSV